MGRFGGYGARPSRPRAGLKDYRELFGVSSVGTPQPIVCPSAGVAPILNQGSTNMCVAYSTAEAHYLLQTAAGLQPTLVSPPYIYGKGHIIAGTTEGGMEPPWAWDCLEQYGACPWSDDAPSTLNSTVATAESSLTAAMDAEAAPFKITGAGVVPFDAADLAAAFAHGPVLFDSVVYPAFEYLTGLQVSYSSWSKEAVALFNGQPPTAIQPNGWNNEQVLGSHQWLGLGLIPGAWLADAGQVFSSVPWWILAQNSWGAGWGTGGRFLVPITYPIQEAWQIAGLAAHNVTPQPQPTPAPSNKTIIVMTIGDTNYTVNGKTETMNQAPILEPTGRTMVPVRFVAEALGATVSWNEALKQVTIEQ